MNHDEEKNNPFPQKISIDEVSRVLISFYKNRKHSKQREVINDIANCLGVNLTKYE